MAGKQGFASMDRVVVSTIGRKGGLVKVKNKGFGSNHDLAVASGKIGGAKSKRGPNKRGTKPLNESIVIVNKSEDIAYIKPHWFIRTLNKLKGNG